MNILTVSLNRIRTQLPNIWISYSSEKSDPAVVLQVIWIRLEKSLEKLDLDPTVQKTPDSNPTKNGIKIFYLVLYIFQMSSEGCEYLNPRFAGPTYF